MYRKKEEASGFEELLGLIFKILGENPSEENRKIAHRIYHAVAGADFAWDELRSGTEECMERFGLAQFVNDEWEFGPTK